MTRSRPKSSGGPVLTATDERVALGPLRGDLVVTYAWWLKRHGDPADLQHDTRTDVPRAGARVVRGLEEDRWRGTFHRLQAGDAEAHWDDTLASVDHRHSTANFAAAIGETDYRAKGYGTEAIRLTLDYAFATLGLRGCIICSPRSALLSAQAHFYGAPGHVMIACGGGPGQRL